MKEGGTEARSRGSALEKALLVLGAVTDQPQPIGLPDIAARIKLPRQTVHRVLAQLERAGLIVRDPARDRFSVGPQLSELALSALYSENQNTPVRNILQELVDDLKETCNVGILRGLDFLYIDRIECDWPLRMSLSTGSSLPAHCSAGGKVLLAYMPAHLRASLLKSAKLRPNTEKSITDVAQLERECSDVRERGYATTVEELSIGIIGVAVPVLDASGRALAALATHGPTTRLTEEKAIAQVPRLQEIANRLAEVWGLDRARSAETT